MTKGGFLGPLSRKLTQAQPARLVPRESAGVAVIFQGSGDDEKVLLIKRAEREGDPWSGQVAFPGGMVSAVDRSFEETARRETAEEVGVDLSSRDAAYLGYMQEQKARTRDVVVVPSVFELTAPTKVSLNKEVASSEWVRLRSLAKDEARSTYVLRMKGGEVPFPSLVHRGLVIWGLTERILSAILGNQPEPVDDGERERMERY